MPRQIFANVDMRILSYLSIFVPVRATGKSHNYRPPASSTASSQAQCTTSELSYVRSLIKTCLIKFVQFSSCRSRVLYIIFHLQTGFPVRFVLAVIDAVEVLFLWVNSREVWSSCDLDWSCFILCSAGGRLLSSWTMRFSLSFARSSILTILLLKRWYYGSKSPTTAVLSSSSSADVDLLLVWIYTCALHT